MACLMFDNAGDCKNWRASGRASERAREIERDELNLFAICVMMSVVVCVCWLFLCSGGLHNRARSCMVPLHDCLAGGRGSPCKMAASEVARAW